MPRPPPDRPESVVETYDVLLLIINDLRAQLPPICEGWVKRELRGRVPRERLRCLDVRSGLDEERDVRHAQRVEVNDPARSFQLSPVPVKMWRLSLWFQDW